MKTKNKNNFPVQKGLTLLKEEPFIYILKSTLRHSRCDYCFASEKLLKCSGCKYVSYCNKVCQKTGWDFHRDECPKLKRVLPRVVPDAARILARMIFKLKRGGENQRGFYTETNFRVFKDLMSHYSDIKKDAKRMEHFTSLSNVLLEYIEEDNMPNSAELLGLYGRLVVNGFNILDPEMVGIGTGIYLAASIIDHSCNPTAVAVFQGTTIFIRSLVDLPDMNWSKVLISYIELLNSHQERQKELMETYYFLCDCSRCKDIEEISLNNSLLCLNYDCGAPVCASNLTKVGCQSAETSLSCLDCNKNIKPEQLKQYLEAYEFVNYHLENMKTFSYLDICTLCLEKQGELFHPLNLQRVKVLDSAFESCVTVGQWDKARNYGKLLLPGYKRYYGELHPLTGILQLKLGKICLYLESCGEAQSMLLAAENILRVTHGRQHPLYQRHLVPLLQQVH